MCELVISEYIYNKLKNESDQEEISEKLSRMTRRHSDCIFALKSQDRVQGKRNYYVRCGYLEHTCARKFRIDVQEIAENKKHGVKVYAPNRVDENWSGQILVLNDDNQLVFERQDLD